MIELRFRIEDQEEEEGSRYRTEEGGIKIEDGGEDYKNEKTFLLHYFLPKVRFSCSAGHVRLGGADGAS